MSSLSSNPPSVCVPVLEQCHSASPRCLFCVPSVTECVPCRLWNPVCSLSPEEVLRVLVFTLTVWWFSHMKATMCLESPCKPRCVHGRHTCSHPVVSCVFISSTRCSRMQSVMVFLSPMEAPPDLTDGSHPRSDSKHSKWGHWWLWRDCKDCESNTMKTSKRNQTGKEMRTV